ncbi:MAG TPA: signal peptidase I [Polyangiaceae bacterium]|nr:signal peptidase I [Polyangiaceae bacterium]
MSDREEAAVAPEGEAPPDADSAAPPDADSAAPPDADSAAPPDADSAAPPDADSAAPPDAEDRAGPESETASSSKPSPKRKRSLLRDALSLAAFLATALIARASLADHYVVPTGSMIPTVHEGDRVIVAKAAYGLRFPMSQTWLLRWSEPKRGDVVVLDSPDEDQVLLKRVVALPGDVVEVRGGKLILNGTRVAASDHDETIDGKHHPLSLASGGGPDFGPSEVPAGKVLVMGDNRGNSRDGRYFGFVEEASVLGHAVAIYVRNGSLVWDAL